MAAIDRLDEALASAAARDRDDIVRQTSRYPRRSELADADTVARIEEKLDRLIAAFVSIAGRFEIKLDL